MAKGATSKKKREEENRQESQQRQTSQQREETRQRQQRTQRETSQNNSASSRQTTRREVAPAAIPVLEERSTPRMSASGRNVASMFPESTAPQTTNIPKVEPIQTNNNGQGFASDVDTRVQRRNEQGIRLDAEERIKASDASQYGTERAEEPQMEEYPSTTEKGRKMAQRRNNKNAENLTMPTDRNGDYQGEGGGHAFGERRLTDYEQYENLKQNGEFEDDIAKLAQINTGSAMGVSANPDMYARGVLGNNEETKGMSLNDYYNYLQDKYNLSAEELDDLALTYKSQLNNEQSARLSEKATQFGEEHPVLGSIASLPTTLANTVEGVNNVLVGGLTGDERRLSNMASGTKQGFREGTKENIDSNAGKVAYDLTMGLGDLGVGVATGQAPAILAGNTANEATLSAVDRGQDVRKAALYGAGSGVLDYITNTIGLDKAKALGMSGITAGGIRGFLKRAGIAAGAEAGENLIQDLGQTFLDELINKENSELSTAVTQRIYNGESVEDAIKETAIDWLKDRGMSLATGALMGGAMFGGTAAINGLRGRADIPTIDPNNPPPGRSDLTELPKVDPAELARQNEIDVNAKVDNVNQAVDEINKLDEEVPDVPDNTRLTDEEVEALQRGIERNAAEEAAMNEVAGFEAERQQIFKEIDDATARGEDPSMYYGMLNDLEEDMRSAHPELFDAKTSSYVGLPNESANVPETPATDGGNPPTTPPNGGGNVPPANGGGSASSSPSRGERNSITNTGIRSGIVTPDDLTNNTDIRDIVGYDIHHNDDIVNQARKDIASNRDMYQEQYASGTKEINSDLDLDRSMLLLTTDDTLSDWTRNSILRNLAEHGTEAGQFIQAFKKWANTATGALAKATKVDVDTTKKWETNNRQRVEANNRVAKAINLIGVPESDVQRVPLTHEQLREQITKTINDAFGDNAKKFTADDIEYLTILAETKKIPVRKITQELEHKLETGEWFTIDESLPVKVERAIKNGQISNMLDRIVNGETPKAEKEPEAYGRFLSKIRNSLQDESLGLADEFDDLDVYFIGKMIQERVPKKTIEDELRHRVETGEWYTIDESIQAPKPTNQKLQNAFKQMRGEATKSEPQPKTYEQIRDEVRNTLEKNGELGNYSDSDIEYLSHLVEQGASTKDIASAMNTKAATGRFGVSNETQAKVNELFETARHYNENSRQFVEAQAEAYKLLAEEVAPDATPLEVFDTWRYLAMLGNPKTMFRNLVGNKMFSTVTGLSNNLGAALEHGADYIYNRTTGQNIQRTKEFLNPVKDKPLIDGAAKYAEDFAWRQVEGSKYEKLDKDSLRHNRSVFKSKLMRLAEQAVDRGISDTNAVIKKFSTSMAGYMKANGIDASAFDDAREYDALERYSRTHLLSDSERAELDRTRPIAAQMDKAREYALKQAEYATFHEDNKIADVLSKWSRISREEGHGIGSLLIEGTVPFKKTPANILKSGFEYSPFGAIKSIAETGKLVYENTGKRKGNLENEYTRTNRLTGKEKTVQRSLASDVLDSWSKTLTGSALTYLGYYLFNKGVLTSSDKGEKYQDQLEGKGNYAININGHTYTLDWAAPGVMPLLIGAEVSKVLKANSILDEEWYSNPDKWMQTINTLLDPLLETSMMSGVKDTLTTAANEVRYNEDNALGGIIGSAVGNMATGYLTQAIPTLSGQIARTIDPVRRTTDTANEGIIGTIEKQGRKVANKIPFLSMINPEYRDAYGRGQTNGPFDYEEGEYGLNALKGLGNLAYQMISPGYYSKVNTTDADRLGRNLFNATELDPLSGEEKAIEGVTNDDKVFATWRSTKRINGEKLDPQQLQTFREEMGQANYALREGLYNAEWYNNLTPQQQHDVATTLNSIADKIGQYAVKPDSVNVNGTLKTYLEAGGGEEGIQAIIDELEADNNPYGLDKDVYAEEKASGKDMSVYEGYSEALEQLGLSDKQDYRYVWENQGMEGLAGIAEYNNAFTDAGMEKVYSSKSAVSAYENDQLDEYKKYRDYISENGIRDSESKWAQWLEEHSATSPTEIQNTTGSTQGFAQNMLENNQAIATLDPQYQSDNNSNPVDYISSAGLNLYSPDASWNKAYTANPDLTPQEFVDTWSAVDSNSNGRLTKAEFVNYLNAIGYTPEQAELFFSMYYPTSNKPLNYRNDKWYE